MVKNKKLKIIEDRAYALGFDGFGVASPKIGEEGGNFSQWLSLGYAGEMVYMARGKEKRRDTNLVLAGVKSIICLRTNYFTAEKGMDFLDNPKIGDVSLYALNKDYHDIITPRLKELEKYIQEEFAGSKTKIYVDTGPILEKPLAQRAGLGWIGKHTNLLSQGIGSWYFLSEILVDVTLPEAEVAENHCGTCRNCIDICPTDAIVAPYVLDSKKCISYLTIELKGVIPIEFRKAIGNRIYGCDDCQIFCPWNKFANISSEPDFSPRHKLDSPTLLALFEWSEETFLKNTEGSAIRRTGYQGWTRNIAIALGNAPYDSRIIEALSAKARVVTTMVQEHIAWAIEQQHQAQINGLLFENAME